MTSARVACAGAIVAAIVVACTAFQEPPATPGSDGGADGEAAGDAASGGVTWCTPKPTTCASPRAFHVLDFASTDMPPAGFASEFENGTVERIAEGNTCTPGALRASTHVPDVDEAVADAVVMRSAEGAFTTGRLAFAFRGTIAPDSGYANIGCALAVRPPSTTQNVRSATRLSLTDDRLVLSGTARDAADDPIDGIPEIELDNFFTPEEALRWHTVDMKLALTKESLTVTATFDGKEYPPYAIPLAAPATRFSIDCGVVYAEKRDKKLSVDIDDVFVELCP